MNFLSSAGAELSALCCQTSSAPHPAARRGWPGARPALLQPAAPAARRAERTGEPEDPQVAERSARAGSGGWRGEPTREIKGQNGGNLCTMRSEKLKSWSSVSPREGGAAVGGDGWVLLELGGARGRGFRGNFYRLLQHHLLLSQSRDAELCTSIESGLQSAGRAGRAGGGSERVSWASPGALTRESQPPEKRKVKEERGSEGEINISGGRGGGGRDGGSCWMTNLGDAAPRPLRWQAHWRARRAGGRRSRSAGAQPRPVPPWVPAEKSARRRLGARPPRPPSRAWCGRLPGEARSPPRGAWPHRPEERGKCFGSGWAATPPRPAPWPAAQAGGRKALKS